jgi:predicted NAD/FAD-dependent oxidoreductase
LRFGVRVTDVEEVAGGGWRILTGDGPLEADAVIVAVPHEEAAAIVPRSVDGRARWSELGSSAIVDVHLIMDREVTNWPIMAALRSPVQWVFDRTASSGLQHSGHQYLAVSLSGADHLLGRPPEDLVRETIGSLGQLLPSLSDAVLVDSTVTKERRATFRAAPGSQSVRPPAETGRAGLMLAGAWTETGWPATMEGAVRSGSAAARALVDAAAGRESIPVPNARIQPKEVA